MASIGPEFFHRSLSGSSSLVAVSQIVATLLLFLFAIRLLGSATDALRPMLRVTLDRVVVGDLSALGLGWVAAYALANGSIVAALSVSLFSSGLVTASQLFLLVVGSRLGGAAVVVFIGALDYLNEDLESVREALSLGLLTFLLTHSVYLPVTVLGYLSLPALPVGAEIDDQAPEVGGLLSGVVSAVTDGLVAVVGPGVAFLIALGCVALSLQVFDSILDSIDTERLRQRYIVELENRWVSFCLGLVVTTLTTSVAFSLGVIVPLYNRGHITPRETMPFVLGANIGTLADTLVVAVALDTPVGILTMLGILALSVVVSLLALVWYRPYRALIGGVQDELMGSRRLFVGVLVSLLVAPLVLIVV